jgi:hypothetical protein
MRGSHTTEPSGVSLAIRWPGLIGLRGLEPLAHDPPSGGITAEVLADEVEVHIDSRGTLQPGRRSPWVAIEARPGRRQSGAFMPSVSLLARLRGCRREGAVA